jgi:hypothetical protein
VFSFELSDSEKLLKEKLNSKHKIGNNPQNNINQNKSSVEDELQEYNPFRKVNLYQFPNSKRTVNPEFGVNSTIKIA